MGSVAESCTEKAPLVISFKNCVLGAGSGWSAEVPPGAAAVPEVKCRLHRI